MENISLFKKVKQLSNEKKFRVIELIQKNSLNISKISKEINISFNKCSNYCTQLEKEGLIEKRKEGKNTLVKSKIIIKENSLIFKI